MSRRRKRRFRVYPDNGVVYYEVRIFRNRKQFINATGDKEAIGLCRSFTNFKISKDGSEQILPRLGVLYFFDYETGIALISHECCHATLRYFHWRKENKHPVKYESAQHKEEVFCRVLSNLVKQVVKNYCKQYPVGYHIFPANPVVLK